MVQNCKFFFGLLKHPKIFHTRQKRKLKISSQCIFEVESGEQQQQRQMYEQKLAGVVDAYGTICLFEKGAEAFEGGQVKSVFRILWQCELHSQKILIRFPIFRTFVLRSSLPSVAHPLHRIGPVAAPQFGPSFGGHSIAVQFQCQTPGSVDRNFGEQRDAKDGEGTVRSIGHHGTLPRGSGQNGDTGGAGAETAGQEGEASTGRELEFGNVRIESMGIRRIGRMVSNLYFCVKMQI